MNRFTFKMFGRTLPVAAAVVVGAVFAGGAAAQDVAKVPIVVNVDASVSAVPEAASGLETVNKSVTANVTDTLLLPLKKTDGVIYFGGKRHADVPTVAANRNGNVTVNLPARSYKSAEVALYTVNGKRVMSGRVSSSNAVNSISRRNVSTGVYLLSVRGADGDAVTARLAHNGGGLTVSAAFGGADIADARKTAKKAADAAVVWTVTVSSDDADSVFTIQPVAENNALLNITLRAGSSGGNGEPNNCGKDGTAGSCKTVTIGGLKWMAENLNKETDDSWCYDENPANCATYGRLYDWVTAMDIDKKYINTLWDGSDVNHQGVCPNGWHLPNRDEWGTLAKAAGGTGAYGGDGGTAGKALKAANGWNYEWENSDAGGGTDEFGFSALPGGRQFPGGASEAMKQSGHWWTATATFGRGAYYRTIYRNGDNKDRLHESSESRNYGYSVRCIAD